MLRRVLPFVPTIAGLFVMIAGFAYEVVVVSIPFQDPPPALQRQYDADAHFASAVISLGALCYIAGIALLVGGWVIRRVRSRAAARSQRLMK